MPSSQIVDLAKEVNDMREKVDEAKAIYSELKQQKDNLEMNLFQSMEIEGVPNFKLEGIGTFYKSTKPWASVSDPEKAQAYFRKVGIFDEIFQLKPTAKRMNEYVKENFIEKGAPIPEEDLGITVNLKQVIGLRRSA